jgi:hypothetical protein
MALQPIVQEILIDEEWVDATPYVRGGNVADIRIQRGFSSEQTNQSVGTCNFTLNNRDGLWSNRNPLSQYYGKVGRNVQVRTGKQTSIVSLRMDDNSTFGTSDYDGACAFTLDKAVLDITGDIDIRIDCEADDWRGRGGFMLCGKYTIAGNQRSWALYSDSYGYLRLATSPDGTLAARIISTSTEPVPDGGRIAIRATLDVNNGAAGNTCTFYTSDTIAGSWTQLGDPVVNAGTTSLFSSSANLIVGNTNESAGRNATFANFDPFVGKIYGFELRSGIAGTLVADFDPTGRTPGDTSWSDGLGTPNTWELQTSAHLSLMDWRFWGEMSNSPTEWDGTGTDVIVPVQAGDLRQRLSQGQPKPRSAIYRNLSNLPDVDGWWTCEDGTGASALSAEKGTRGGFTDASFSVASGFPGTAGMLIFTDDNGFAYGNAVVGASTGVATFMWYWKLDAVPVSGTPVDFMQGFYTGGTVARCTVDVNVNSYGFTFYSNTGAVLDNSNIGFGSGAEPDQYIGMRVMLTQNGGNVDWEAAWYAQGAPTIFGGSGSFAGTVGRPRAWNSPPFADKFGMELGHVLLSRGDVGFETDEFTRSTNAYVNEPAATRAQRLAAEEDLPLFLVGKYYLDGDDITRRMGAQGLFTPLELFQQCADADGGILYSPRGKYGLEIRWHSSLANRTGPAFSYPLGHFSGRLLPKEGDFGIRNDVTVSRPSGGGEGRFVKTSGPLNTTDPRTDPQGIGVAPGSAVVNAWPDQALDDHAAWAAHLGTWDEPRWNTVQWDTHRAPYVADTSLYGDVAKLDLGDRFDILSPPVWVGAETPRLMFRGYTETLVNFTQTIVCNAAPYSPYLINDFTLSAESVFAIGDDGLTTLGTGIDDNDTSLTAVTDMAGLGLYWDIDGDTLIRMAGEVMTLTAVGAPSVVGDTWEQTFTVTRSATTPKAHTAGTVIEIAEPFYLDL